MSVLLFRAPKYGKKGSIKNHTQRHVIRFVAELCDQRVDEAPRKALVLNGGGGQNRFGIPFWLVEFTTHFRAYLSGDCGRCTNFRTYLSGDWDVHWGYDLDFDPWPSSISCDSPKSTLPQRQE